MLKAKGVKMIVLIILAVTTAGMSKNAPTPKTRISALDPAVFKIAPLNENSANSIEASGLGQLMSRPDKQRLDFQTKVKTVGDQMQNLINFNKIDRTYFTYDCLFLTDEALATQYPNISKINLLKAKKFVGRRFSK